MTFPKFAPLALLALAACSQEPAEPEAPAPTAAATAAPQPETTAAAPAGTIPAAYRGAWDWTGGSCAALSDLRMEIGAEEIHFYESVGEVQAVREREGALEIDLAMEGEGMQWTQTTMLRMVDGDLLETEHDDPAGEGRMRLRRCPGETTTP